MRILIVSTLLAGTLSACITPVAPRPLTLAERTEQCRSRGGGQIAATGRETGDARQDYRCVGTHGRDRSSAVTERTARASPIDRTFRPRS